jgi:phosphopantothenoylcysteine decarboxylase/phosphopantothenate--cysteine ligase
VLTGKTIILGVTGSIAAYKTAMLASALIKQHADVHVLMTENATKFITPLTFETLTGNKCVVDTFDRNFSFDVKHVSLAKKAVLVLIAPCSANVIGKLSNGICDDILTTTLMATKATRIIAPAMNTGMWENPIMQDNLKRLQAYGYHIITPATGRLACGDTGMGKMPEPDTLLEHILLHIAKDKDLKGKRILVSAGPTQEAIDPVRYITNHSSGKMGYAIAKMAAMRGAEVSLISGPVNINPFTGVCVVHVKSAQDMYDAVKKGAANSDIIIMCSAVADYTPMTYYDQKVKKNDSDLSIPLKRTQDILKYLGEHKQEGQLIIGFSMETENLLENSRQKLTKKNADMICANSINEGKTGFAVNTNQVTLITPTEVHELPLCTKDDTANMILDKIKELK